MLQVFEAYNDEDEEESGESTWDEFLSPEEKVTLLIEQADQYLFGLSFIYNQYW